MHRDFNLESGRSRRPNNRSRIDYDIILEFGPTKRSLNQSFLILSGFVWPCISLSSLSLVKFGLRNSAPTTLACKVRIVSSSKIIWFGFKKFSRLCKLIVSVASVLHLRFQCVFFLKGSRSMSCEYYVYSS